MRCLSLLCCLALLTGCFGAPGYEGDAGPHFDGKHFHNRAPLDQGTVDFLRFGLGSLTQSTRWPESVEIQPGQIDRPRVTEGLDLTFVNHATFLIQVDGLNILTDPVYGERVSPVSFAGPKRVHPPGIAFEDLPPIDVILLSHNHYDHIDEPTLRRFADRADQQPLVIAGLGNHALLESFGLRRIQELDWNQHLTMGETTIHFTECRHRSGRGMTDHMKTLWGSFVIETSIGPVYFAGDTGYGPHFAEARERFGNTTLALLPIGAYEPRFFMAAVHLNPADAVAAHQDLGAKLSVGIHFGTFQLTWEGREAPLRDLETAMTQAELAPGTFRTLDVGNRIRLPPPIHE